jgi:hypothetical protein
VPQRYRAKMAIYIDAICVAKPEHKLLGRNILSIKARAIYDLAP